MGYPGTTGLTAMDYYFADRFHVPAHHAQGQFVEKVAHLPANAPFQPARLAPPVNGLPALHNGYLTFGSFNRINKLQPRAIALWSELLRALPDSRMLLGAMPPDAGCETLIEWFGKEGIARERLDFRTRAGMPVYLQQHHQVDICLDTFPYSGGTTTVHAMWMGVPTITLAGHLMASRGSTAALSFAGLSDFVAKDSADFVAKGVAWANDLTGLAELRASMRSRCAESPMFQPAVIAAGLSASLREMWRRWCAGVAPAALDVQMPVATARNNQEKS
jgi:predicted O-linked N-acetylglucosamine transferase (SPINDLY family)